SRLGITSGCKNYAAPCQVGTASDWKSLAVGNGHAVGIKSDGSLWAWGDNTLGQVGIPGAYYPAAPVEVGAEHDWSSVSASVNYSLAIKSDGTLWSWGDNAGGQLGTGTVGGSVMAPEQVGTATNWAMVSANRNHVLGVRTDGTLWAWGYNSDGVLGL